MRNNKLGGFGVWAREGAIKGTKRMLLSKGLQQPHRNAKRVHWFFAHFGSRFL